MLRHASDVAAVDASPEMLAIAASRVPGGALVRFAEADVFTWEPDCRYDVVFTGFWLSHVPGAPETVPRDWRPGLGRRPGRRSLAG